MANGGGPLEGFAIEGNGQKAWAQAQIEGETVVVSSPSVPNPEFVYYNWKQTPVPLGNLYNVEGLPASPFRTNSPLSDDDTDTDIDIDDIPGDEGCMINTLISGK